MYLLNQSFEISLAFSWLKQGTLANQEVSLPKKAAKQRVKIQVRWTTEMEDQLVDWWQQHKCL